MDSLRKDHTDQEGGRAMFRDAGEGLHLFETALGVCAFSWTPRGVDRFVLPSENRAAVVRWLRAEGEERSETDRPPRVVSLVRRRVRAHLGGKPDSLRDIPVDLQVAPFSGRVYRALRRVDPGEVVTYGELARRARSPGASRAVGRAMATNPVPLLVPCHRVLTHSGGLGGFTSEGGLPLKARMLHAEGVIPDESHSRGMAHLSRRDPVLRRIIRGVGPYTAGIGAPGDPYDVLVESIIHQQISMKAAATIAGRVRALTDGPAFPRPHDFLGADARRLRKAGLSKQKVSYLRDLSRAVESGELRPGALRRHDDEQVVECLTRVRGIGRWSAEMFLIFHLGRLDILPVDDLGLRAGIQAAYALAEPPTKAEALAKGEDWRPFRSMATWYLWQHLKREAERRTR
ncbi:MAG: methylated-DNA--[protein]-cysteine S-methyltransferase [Gemmatimonadota bacterium]|nr:methylated-DNA--[protein]-cysteine S-methyltransferase [Gemmatimonadota bacterium]